MPTHHPLRFAKNAALACVSALFFAGAGLSAADTAAQPAPRLFGGMMADAVHLVATVEKINYETREVTLLDEKGEVRTIIAGPDVKRLAEIKPGDTIEVGYVESVVVLAGDAAGAPAREEKVDVIRAGKEEKPGGALVKTTRVTATVEALDPKSRKVTLKGPKRTMTIQVGADAVNFDKVRVGDSVYVEFTQAVAAAVTKSAKAK